jgi:hypothetical protein
MKPDPARKMTDEMLGDVETRIGRIYRKADTQLKKYIEQLMAELEPELGKWEKWVEDGKKTEAQLRQWKMEKLIRGKKAKEINQKIAELLYRANQEAAKEGNKDLPTIAALNANYALFEYEEIVNDQQR